jgi:4-diphosphocytidyl-2-C-methyl-D-erythritol kinase
MTLAARAPGKVNLCLYLGETRDDGLHALVSLVQPVSLADELWLEPAPGAEADAVECPGVDGPNLATAALAAYREATGWDAPPQRLRIAKHVPVAAGMGGGSGDAAAALRLAAHAAGVDDEALLLALAATLGGDVPSQVAPGRTLMTGAGEHVRPLPPPGPLALVILPSEHTLSTPAVYREFDRLGVQRSAAELAELEGRGADLPVHNDLQDAARSLCPSIEEALDLVGVAGAEHVLVSGSGPTVFGLYRDPERALAAADAVGGIAAEPVDAAFGAVHEA